MAKPIFILNVPFDLVDEVKIKDIYESLSDKLYDYHVIINLNASIKEYEYLTYNDCKGLTDVDIEKLIKDFKNGK